MPKSKKEAKDNPGKEAEATLRKAKRLFKSANKRLSKLATLLEGK